MAQDFPSASVGVERVLEKVKSSRKQGDSRRKMGDERGAIEAFGEGLASIEAALAQIDARPSAVSAEDHAELLGAKGGLLSRLGLERRHDALRAYELGAQVEVGRELSSTYNRLNAIKHRLTTGMSRLADLVPELKSLCEFIEGRLREDSALSDSGWAWSDLGDCRALLGDRDQALAAYRAFIEKAELKSPSRSLDVLRGLVQSMEAAGDPDAQRTRAAAELLEQALA